MNETLRTLHSLRSIHGDFSGREVSAEDLHTILTTCVRAATASARQAYSIVVVEDKAIMRQLGYVGSKVLVFCVDYTRLFVLADACGYVYKKIGMEDFITGSTDTILAAQTAAIAAKSLGIDSLFTNCVHRGEIARVHRLLDLPREYCFPLIALVLGYPKTEPKDGEKGRLCGPGVIHFGAYHRLTPDEVAAIIQQYDDPNKHFLALISHWREQGYAHYLEYLFGHWLQCAKRKDQTIIGDREEAPDSQIVNLLRTTGFLADTDRGKAATATTGYSR